MAQWEKNVPAPETPAQRHARDIEAMRGDWQGTNGNLNRLDPVAKLTYVADGRHDRTFAQRGGDIYGTEQGTWHNEVDGRNSRIYVDRTTKLSDENGQKSEVWDSPAVHKS